MIKCKVCEYWQYLGLNSLGTYGECRYNPPFNIEENWCRTFEDDWCGKGVIKQSDDIYIDNSGKKV